MHPLRILYIAHRIPYPPNKGEKIRAFHQIRHLSRTHEVHLACLVDEREDLEHTKTLEKYCASVDVVFRRKTAFRLRAMLGLLTNKPLSVTAFYDRELAKRIGEKLRAEEFDRIVVFSSAMAEYVRHTVGVPKVIDLVDADSEKWRLFADYHPKPLSWLYRLEASHLSRYEEEVVRMSDRSVFVSEAEAELLQQRVPERSMTVISNGVDLDYFAPTSANLSSSKRPVVVFTGAMDYFPNGDAVQYFCRDILPLITETCPEVRFYIVGRHPTRQVRALGRQRHVVVTGSVPDVRPYLRVATVAVAPLRIARGVQNKILEAMAMGLPVVGTSSAFQGLRVTTTDGIRRADDPKHFAQEILALLENSTLQRQCSLQARQFVQQHHRWQDHGASLELLLHEIQ
jgi:sugar transferase (PEP-CTERM/EpsH1 system associated)